MLGNLMSFTFFIQQILCACSMLSTAPKAVSAVGSSADWRGVDKEYARQQHAVGDIRQ